MAFKIGDTVVLELKDEPEMGTVIDVTPEHSFVDFYGSKNPVCCYNEELQLYSEWESNVLKGVNCFTEVPTEDDAVDSPSHYNNGNIECIEYLRDNLSWEGFTGYLEGNCKKYMHRWRYKQKPLEDLKKARWYLDRLISELED